MDLRRQQPGALMATTWPSQNWVLSPVQDVLLIIAAPCITLVLALAAFVAFEPAQATALVVGIHVVFTVAHHMPTFIRIYGDLELLRRFKWTLLLAPLIPLTCSLGILAYINHKNHPVEYFLYLYLMLALWDPWHFLRQHYGFMRIYDRHNAAPKRLAARMDLMLCAACFVFVMLASGEWLPDLLADLYTSADLPFLMAVPARALRALTTAAGAAALIAAAVYALYLYWCWRKRYYISIAKIALCLATFCVMYLAYTPNAWILRLAPAWSFKVGFAAVGVVHMTQYLAIVWRYNRSIAARAERSRAGLFRNLHSRGGWLAGASYVSLCLLYGDLITTRCPGRWLMSVVLAVGFTSTLLHYYFDGFIWRLRHRQNEEHLGRAGGSGADHSVRAAASWWRGARDRSAGEVLLRQTLYFGLPIAILTCGAVVVWTGQPTSYVPHMYRAQTLESQGLDSSARHEARLAFDAMQRQLPYARRLAELQPTAARDAELAFLIYNHSRYAHSVIPFLDGRTVGPDEASLYLAGVEEAIGVLQRAISRGGSLAHSGRDAITSEDAVRVLESWKRLSATLQTAPSESGRSPGRGRSSS